MLRGEVCELRAPRQARGHEQAGPRYGIVLQSSDLPLSTVLVAPTSTAPRPASFRPEVEIAGSRTLVLCEQLAAIDAERLGQSLGVLPWRDLERVDRALKLVLGLE